MAYNTRRSGEAPGAVGARRNPPIGNNFVPGGQLPPQNRPQQQHRPRGPSNGNFRPQQPQRFSGPASQRPQGPPAKMQPPPQQQQKQQPLPQQQKQQPLPQQQKQQPPQQPKQQPPQQQQQQPPQQQQQQQQPLQQQQQQQPLQQQQQQQQPPPQQQQQQPSQPTKQETPPSLMAQDVSKVFPQDEEMPAEDQNKKKPFWATRLGKISRKERQRRRNVRLGKMLQPKNAVMILNELVKSATYTVTDFPQPSEMNQYTASVLVDGVSHVGHGRSKMEAKSMAAELALKYIVKNKQYTALKKEEDEDVKMDVAEDGTPTLPWQHVASFALFKLLHSWGEDPNVTRGAVVEETTMAPPPQNKPAKKMPANAAHMNPLMLLNQMLPQAQFEELARTGTAPNLIFNFQCVVNNQTFTGSGPNKKAAKKMAAFAVCHKVLGIQYAPEMYTPPN